jgi:hypothetical protein
MAFNLHIEFAGPCLYVLDTDSAGITQQVGVLIPDCRGKTHGDRPKHQDRDLAELHVGYVRLDLADVIPNLPPGRIEDQPRYELVHRFTGQVVDFAPALATEPVDVSNLHLPSFDQIAPRLEPKAGFFGPAAPSSLLMRMILRGGRFESQPDSVWMFSNVLNPDGKPYVVRCASTVTWKRKITGERITVSIRDFDKKDPEAEFNLGPFPEGYIVTLSVANLCAVNPLEWADLASRGGTDIDRDFKWLYRLLRTTGSSTVQLPAGAKLPAPVLVSVSPDETSEEACMGAKITGEIGE